MIDEVPGIKTHESESRGQERPKQSPKPKHVTNYRVSFTQANVFVIIKVNISQAKSTLNSHCRHKVFLATFINTPKIEAIG